MALTYLPHARSDYCSQYICIIVRTMMDTTATNICPNWSSLITLAAYELFVMRPVVVLRQGLLFVMLALSSSARRGRVLHLLFCLRPCFCTRQCDFLVVAWGLQLPRICTKRLVSFSRSSSTPLLAATGFQCIWQDFYAIIVCFFVWWRPFALLILTTGSKLASNVTR